MPTLTQLEYIVAVEKSRHFGKAAILCNVSQPSLSLQVQKVEEEMGIKIFDRAKKPIMPTDRGRLFIEQAFVILRESQKLMAVTNHDKNIVRGEFRLGIIPTLAPYLLPLFLEAFSQSFPLVKLKIDELKTETIISELKENTLDGAILATPLHEKALKETVLFFEPFYLYVGKDHAFSNKKTIREDDLEGSDMWLLQDGHCLRNQVVKICAIKEEMGIYKNVSFEGGNLETLRYLVKKSRSYTLIPQLFVNTLPDEEKKNYVKAFEGPTPSREVSLIFRKDQWKTDILAAIETTILKHLPANLKLETHKKRIRVVGI